MHILITILAALALGGGVWAFWQSPAGTQWPIPIAVAGAVVLAMTWMK